jgi:hypothetical protein
MIRRRSGRALPLGHKARGRQRVKRGRQFSPLKQRSTTGTQATALPYGVLPTEGGAAGYRTLERAPASRAPKIRVARNIVASPFQVGPNTSATSSSPFEAPVFPSSGRGTMAPVLMSRKARIARRKKGGAF